MKPILLACALPLLLTGCAGSYYSDYPGYYYGPGPYAYDAPYYDDGVGVAFYGGGGGYYHHGGDYDHRGYHHYDTASHTSAIAHSGYRTGGAHYASVRGSHASGGSHGAAVHASSGFHHQ